METVNSFRILGVVAVLLALILFLHAKSNYRRCVICAEHLTEGSFEIRRYVGAGVIVYFIGRRRLSFLEVYFAKRDISLLAKKGTELKREYCNGLGKVIDEENDVFKALLSDYKSELLKWHRRFSLTPYERSRPRAPYSYLRESYASRSASLAVYKIDTHQMVL